MLANQIRIKQVINIQKILINDQWPNVFRVLSRSLKSKHIVVHYHPPPKFEVHASTYVSKAQRVSHRSSTEWACPKALAPESPSRSLEAELNDEVPSGWWTGCFAKYARRWDLLHSSGEHSMEKKHCYHHHRHVHRHYFEAFYLHTSSLGFGLTKASSLQLQELHELAYEASRTRACCYNRCTCRKEGRL